jgi:hypothetical protein
MSSADIVDTIWQTVHHFKQSGEAEPVKVERVLSECVNNVLRRAMIQQSEDNLTLIIVWFKDLVALLG